MIFKKLLYICVFSAIISPLNAMYSSSSMSKKTSVFPCLIQPQNLDHIEISEYDQEKSLEFLEEMKQSCNEIDDFQRIFRENCQLSIENINLMKTLVLMAVKSKRIPFADGQYFEFYKIYLSDFLKLYEVFKIDIQQDFFSDYNDLLKEIVKKLFDANDSILDESFANIQSSILLDDLNEQGFVMLCLHINNIIMMLDWFKIHQVLFKTKLLQEKSWPSLYKKIDILINCLNKFLNNNMINIVKLHEKSLMTNKSQNNAVNFNALYNHFHIISNLFSHFIPFLKKKNIEKSVLSSLYSSNCASICPLMCFSDNDNEELSLPLILSATEIQFGHNKSLSSTEVKPKNDQVLPKIEAQENFKPLSATEEQSADKLPSINLCCVVQSSNSLKITSNNRLNA